MTVPLPPGCTVEDWNRSIDDVLELLPMLWPGLPTLTPSEYAAKYRIMPLSDPFPGPWSNTRTPYALEVMDEMGPQSPIIEDWILKGHQLGLTAAAENILLYWMDYNPANLLYVSATDDLLKVWSTERLEKAIDSIPGLREKMTAPIERTGARRSGDTARSKQFIGGNLDMASAQSASGLRSQSRRVLILDEMDGAPPQLKTGEGNYANVAMARTDAYGKRRKILGFSTPTTYEDSLIWQKYLAGDQRKYLVPCPHCGHLPERVISLPGQPATTVHPDRGQELVLSTGDMRHGLKGDFKSGEFQKAYYICEFCGEAIFDYHKPRMLEAGHWEPTARASYPEYRSRHISTLYAPPGMCGWDELYRKYIEARASPEGMRSFTNLELGLPFQEAGARPDLKTVISLRGGYHAGTIPPGVLYLTMGVDVQRGRADCQPASLADLPEAERKRKALEGPRLELEILGHGAGYRSWSIVYEVFPGAIDDPYAGAWEDLQKWALEKGLVYTRADGMAFPVQMVLIDSGDAADGKDEIVARFCQRWGSTYPSKGFNYLKVQAREKGDIPGRSDFKRFRKAIMGGTGLPLFEISTNYFKDALYNRLEIKRRAGETVQPAGFCDFPTEYGDEYFAQLTAEEKIIAGESAGAYKKTRARNEALDCRIYAMAAGEAYLDALVEQKKAECRAAGWDKLAIDKVDHRLVLQFLEKACAMRSAA